MYDKTKLKPYLLTVFSIIIIFAGIITFIGTFGLVKTKGEMQKFIDQNLEAELAVKTCRIEVNVAARNLRDMIITDNAEDYEIHKKRIDNSIQTINEQIEIFKKTYGEADGLAKKYEDAFHVWFEIASRAMTQIEQNNKTKAKDIVINECTPALDGLVVIVKEINAKSDQQKIDVENKTQNMIIFFIAASVIVFIISLLISVKFALKVTKNISQTTNKINDAVTELSKGNLKTSIDYHAHNEFGELAERMNFCFQELSTYVEAIGFGMGEFAAGNFTVESPIEFLGDFAKIEKSITRCKDKMNYVLKEISTASDQVHEGANQVAIGAQCLAEGATDQAGSIEELSAKINDISIQIDNNASNSKKSNELGKETGILLEQGITEMKQMLDAMNEIAVSSQGISKIIKVIDDIVFQTNILSLNASIEAARAGQAGKGFAIVADEVRVLAQKSAEASKDINVLIENSLQSVTNGTEIANGTNEAFKAVAQKSGEVLDIVEQIAIASEEQAAAVTQITYGVDQISSVVQTNSATSQESAAASEELSSQAQLLQSLIGQFKLKE